MQVSHSVSAVFDDPNLVSVAGLAPVLALAERAGLHQLVGEHLTVAGSAGANATVKIPALVACMVAGADSSKTWTCCATAAWAGCSARCGRRRRWALTCAGSPSATSASSTRSRPG